MVQTAKTPGTSTFLPLISWRYLCVCAPRKVRPSQFILYHPCAKSFAVQYLCALIVIRPLIFKQWGAGKLERYQQQHFNSNGFFLIIVLHKELNENIWDFAGMLDIKSMFKWHL